ncbi:MAG TPA: isoprenylcysteine carboxylmethyltransferase family protein [Silvibacterium sp.]|nr:isoprenylcysteine carboxylmethyltransferase family protein [Silvibacterium sp.]
MALLIIWVLAGIGAKRSTTRQTESSRLLQLGIEFLGFCLLFGGWFDRGWLAIRIVPRIPAVVFTGLAMTLAGMAFCYWARAVLGRNWSANVTIKQDHQLVHRGPYSLVRHPIYTGLLFAMLGTALVYGHVRCFVGVFCAGLGWWLKLRVEEQFMLQQFGEQYSRYRQEVRALIPFVL